jgi:uncharacterized protein with PQ loop repeat
MTVVASVVGVTGAVIQLIHAHTHKNMDSFAWEYLLTSTVAEIIFAVQAYVFFENKSLTVAKMLCAVYFGYLLILYVSHQKKRPPPAEHPTKGTRGNSFHPAPTH